MFRVYVAGPYNSDSIVGALDNMRNGMRIAYTVLKAGFAPFVPWFDYHFSLIGSVSRKEYHEYSLTWLLVCDAVLLVEGWQKSQGTLKEIELAKANNIPIFKSLGELQAWKIKQTSK